MTTKRCIWCHHDRPLNQFSINRGAGASTDGLQSHCKPCNRLYCRAYYHLGKMSRSAVVALYPELADMVRRVCLQAVLKGVESKDWIAKTCSECNQLLPAAAFYAPSATQCKRCRQVLNEVWQQAHQDQVARANRAGVLRRKYAMTLDQEEELLAQQEHACAICRTPFDGVYPHVDHCHRTGRIRGLLCSKCNHGLGLLGDDLLHIERALRYLTIQ